MIYKSIELSPTHQTWLHDVRLLFSLLCSLLNKTGSLPILVREFKIVEDDSPDSDECATDELETIFELVANLLPNLPKLQIFV